MKFNILNVVVVFLAVSLMAPPLLLNRKMTMPSLGLKRPLSIIFQNLSIGSHNKALRVLINTIFVLVETSKLNISSRLLGLAHHVRKDDGS